LSEKSTSVVIFTGHDEKMTMTEGPEPNNHQHENKVMEEIYWGSLRGHYEWLFKYHFKEDYFQD
jgi:hypothetical protein